MTHTITLYLCAVSSRPDLSLPPPPMSAFCPLLSLFRYSVPGGDYVRSVRSEPDVSCPVAVCHVMHRGLHPVRLSPANVQLLATGQMEIQLWATAETRRKPEVFGCDSEEFLGSAYISTGDLLGMEASVSGLYPVIRPHATALANARIRAHVVLDTAAHLEKADSITSSAAIVGQMATVDGTPVHITVDRAMHLPQQPRGPNPSDGMDQPSTYISYQVPIPISGSGSVGVLSPHSSRCHYQLSSRRFRPRAH